MKPVRIDVPGVEDRLNRAPADPSTAQPHERPQPRGEPRHIQVLRRREGVEIAGKHVEAVLMPLDALAQIAREALQLEDFSSEQVVEVRLADSELEGEGGVTAKETARRTTTASSLARLGADPEPEDLRFVSDVLGAAESAKKEC